MTEAVRGRVKSTTGLNMRDKPNGNKIDVLRHNETFEILDQVTFYRVRTEEGQVGYLHGDYVEKIPNEESIVTPEAPIVDGLSSEFEKITFTHPQFIGDPVTVDKDFAKELNRVGHFAEQCQCKIWVTSSLRAINTQVRGAIVKPATKSCHHIGHAIDMNLMFNGKLYNSKKLKKSRHGELPAELRRFFDLIREDEVLRWGGDFRTEDPVHIDDNFYHKQTIFYQAKLDSRVRQMNA